MSWVPFWFEANLYFGMVENLTDLKKVMEIYILLQHKMTIGDARECDRRYEGGSPWSAMPPKFGYARECDSKKTLADFFEENGMPSVLIVLDEKELGV